MVNPSTDTRDLLEDFAAEAIDSLRALPALLEQLRGQSQNSEPLHAVFRAIHSIKGNAGFFGLAAIRSFAHTLESSLDELRMSHAAISATLAQALLESFDQLELMIATALEGQLQGDLNEAQQAILARVARLADNDEDVRTERSLLNDAISLTAEIQEQSATPGPVETPQVIAPPAAPRFRQVRVREERLDEFSGHVASLFVTVDLLKDVQRRWDEASTTLQFADELGEVVDTLEHQVGTLHRSVASLRRVAIGNLLAKFGPMARTLAAQLGKQIEVEIEGSDTEVDKSLCEALDAPLTHMVRNAVDHALEMPAERTRRGLASYGRLRLRVKESSSHLQLIVEDDGRGIDPARLRTKALEKRLLSRETAEGLSDNHAIELIFLAGMSTAERLTEVSGRGVGMDVVRSMVREQQGEIRVQSTLGKGTTFVLEFPLRDVATVVNGVMLTCAGQEIVVPANAVVKHRKIAPRAVSGPVECQKLQIDGVVYPAVWAGNLLRPGSRQITVASHSAAAVVVRSEDGELCLLADELLGRRQVVVDRRSEITAESGMLAGVAQLGGGRLVLVLSVPHAVRSIRGARGGDAND